MWLVVALLFSIPLGLDLYMPVPEDNPITSEKVELGRQLFQDRRLSRDGRVACVSCHDSRRAFSTPQAQAVGVFNRKGRRNAPALINRAWGRAFFWDGRVATLEEQVRSSFSSFGLERPARNARFRCRPEWRTLFQDAASGAGRSGFRTIVRC